MESSGRRRYESPRIEALGSIAGQTQTHHHYRHPIYDGGTLAKRLGRSGDFWFTYQPAQVLALSAS